MVSHELCPTQHEATIHRRLKPLERPRVGFRIEHAAHANDSLWVVVRITIPHRAIRCGENLEADFALHTEAGAQPVREEDLLQESPHP